MTKLLNYEHEYTTRNPEWPIGISSGAVVYRKNNDNYELLLVVNGKDTQNPSYNLPKGTLHIDETLEQCALREIREEAGVNVEIVSYLGGSNNTYYYKEIELHKIFHYFAAKYINEAGDMDHEHEDKVWLDIESAKSICRETEPEKNESAIIETFEKFLSKYGG